MKRLSFGTCVVFAVLVMLASFARADSFSAYTSNLGTFYEGYEYLWNTGKTIPSNEIIDTAKLTFINLDAYAANDVLNIYATTSNLGKTLTNGVASWYESSEAFTSNEFLGDITGKTQYGTWSSALSAYSYTYDLNVSNIPTGSNLYLGFDPDCHFTHGKISLYITTSPVATPEPATLILLMAGMLVFGIVPVRKRLIRGL